MATVLAQCLRCGAVCCCVALRPGSSARIPQLAKSSKLDAHLVHGHPVLEVEVVYTARHEFCSTARDFLARRSRLAFLDVAAAKQARYLRAFHCINRAF